MNQLLIRKATRMDLSTLLQFEQGVINAERSFDSTLADASIHYYDITQMIEAPEVELLVAELNQEIVASGYARIEPAKPYLKHALHAYLGFMYVVPQHRGKGINKKIMEALQTWAASKNIMECRLDVYQQNQPAIQAYEKDGFIKHMICMRKSL